MEFSDLSKQLSMSFLVAVMSFPALAGADVERDCKSSLSAMAWVFQKDRHDYPLKSENAGGALHGLECDEVEIIAWFEENSWTLLRTRSASGEWSGYGSRRFRIDRGLVFCRPQPYYLGWLNGGCRGQTAVSMFEGRITQIHSGPTK